MAKFYSVYKVFQPYLIMYDIKNHLLAQQHLL